MATGWRTAILVAALLALAAPVLAHGSMPFNPTLDVFVSSPAPSANSNLRLATSLAAGHHALGTWSAFMPAGWDVSADSDVFDGDVVARGTMSVDTDCDGSIDTYGPFDLVDTPVSGPQVPDAEWTGQITSWWNLVITVDHDPGQPFDLSADLANFSQFHTMCAPQTFIVTVLGRSSPHNDIVLTNPSSAGAYTWQASFSSWGGEHITNVNDPVCIGNNCDSDSDGVADVSDNCPTWPNPSQTLPPWPVPTDDPDCDGFSSAVENPAGTNALVHCGINAWPADINNDGVSDISDIATLGGSFGGSVPPAPARHNIAPNPVDGFVDITDISTIGAFFGKTCAPCPADLDCDTIGDAVDNCPSWPNPGQDLPPWPVPPNDPDCDGFSTAVENSAGTASQAHCGVNAWPADLNNDGSSDITDISALGGSFGKSVPPAPARHNIAPDPVDTFVDITDISTIGGFFGKTCS